MASVTGLTAARMEAIEAMSVVDGEVVGDDLILKRFDDSTINAGNVRGPQGGVTTGSYTPVLTATTTNPVLGANGLARGRWIKQGNLIIVLAELRLAGTGVDFGGASWRISYPFLPDYDFHTRGFDAAPADIIGYARIRSGNAADSKEGIVFMSSDNDTMLLYAAGSNSSVGGDAFTTSAAVRIHATYVFAE